jgi:hypothetical protein
MSFLRERPRLAAAMGLGLVVLLGLAMLVGGALAGDDCRKATAKGSGGMNSPTQR